MVSWLVCWWWITSWVWLWYWARLGCFQVGCVLSDSMLPVPNFAMMSAGNHWTSPSMAFLFLSSLFISLSVSVFPSCPVPPPPMLSKEHAWCLQLCSFADFVACISGCHFLISRPQALGAISYDLIMLRVHIEFERDCGRVANFPVLGSRGLECECFLNSHAYLKHFG